MPRSNNRALSHVAAAHGNSPLFMARRAPAPMSFRERLAMPIECVEDHYALPRPSEIVVVYPQSFKDQGCLVKAPRKGDYLFFRQPTVDRVNGYWFVKMRPADGPKGERWSTERRFDELECAKQDYINYLAVLRANHLGKISPESCPVPEILERFVADLSRRYYDLKVIRSSRLDTAMDAIGRLLPIVDTMRVGDIKKVFSATYMAWARALMPAGGGYAHNTARGALCILKEALESILSSEWNSYHAPFEIPKPEFSFIEIFNPDEIERIPVAAETGRQWDSEAKKWRQKLDPTTGELVFDLRRTEVARAAAPYSRLFQMGIWFGNRVSVSLNVSWMNDGGPWFDLQRGILHRLGSEEEETSKRKGFCHIPPHALPILRAWRAEDLAHGCVNVIHTYNYLPLKEVCYSIWHRLMAAAGARELAPHACKHTCAQVLKLEGVPIEQASAYLFTTLETLINRYGRDWDVGMTRDAAAAISAPVNFLARHREEEMLRSMIGDHPPRSAPSNANDAPAAAAA
jgi:hypothetical protein